MKLEQSFEVAAPIDRVWRTLIDVEHVAPCLPGAAVTGRNEDGSYNGTFTVKIGPTTASYTGRLEMEHVDEAARTATMQAQGTDKRGQGGAKATIESRLAPADGQGTRVEVVTDYHITGRLARFGRGGMIEDISERLLREFAKRLQSSLAAQPAERAAAAGAAAEGAARADAAAVGAAAEAAARADASEAAEPEGAAAEAPALADPTAPTVVRQVPEWAATEAPTEVPPPVSSTSPEPPTEVSEPAAQAVVPAEPEPAAAEPTPEPPPVAPPPPPAAAQTPPVSHPPMPTEPMQGLSLVGSVVWGRIKRNPAPAAAAGVAVVLLIARRRRRR